MTEVKTRGKEERLISSQLQRGAAGDAPAADNGSLSLPVPSKHTLTKKKKKHTDTYLHGCTRAHKLWSACISIPFMDNKRCLENVQRKRERERESSPCAQLSASLSPTFKNLTFFRQCTCLINQITHQTITHSK